MPCKEANMDSQPWLSKVRQRLARHALPPNYVQRFIEELSDHLEDLKEENMEGDANSRLGEPEQVADNAVAAYRRRSFLGRHPVAAFLVFGVSPVVSLFVLFFIFGDSVFLVLASIGITHGSQLETIPSAAVISAMSLLTIIIPSAVATILYCRLAQRIGIARTWGLVAYVILAIFASAPCYLWIGAGHPLHPLVLEFRWAGLSLGVRAGWIVPAQHFVQFLVPLAIGWWLMRR